MGGGAGERGSGEEGREGIGADGTMRGMRGGGLLLRSERPRVQIYHSTVTVVLIPE